MVSPAARRSCVIGARYAVAAESTSADCVHRIDAGWKGVEV
jgi:hypothetical protein